MNYIPLEDLSGSDRERGETIFDNESSRRRRKASSDEEQSLDNQTVTPTEEDEEEEPPPPPQQQQQQPESNGYHRLNHDEPIWSKRMLLLPGTLLLVTLITLLTIGFVGLYRRITTKKIEIDSSLFPFSIDKKHLKHHQHPLRLIHTNDLHARFQPTNAEGKICHELRKGCVGGSAFVKATIDHLRHGQKVPRSVVLNGGDEFQGSVLNTLFRGNLSAEILNLVEYDVMGLGNHEFDQGPSHLAGYLDKLKTPVVCANLRFVKDLPGLQAAIQPYAILDGRVGVIGVLTEDTMVSSSLNGILEVTDPAEAVRTAIKRLRKKGIQRIAVLSHLGYEADKQLAKQVEGISVVVGGHSHTLPKEYPLWVMAAEGEWQTAVVQAKSHGEYVGYMDVVFNDDGSLDSQLTRGKNLLVDVVSDGGKLHGMQPDQRVGKVIQSYVEKAQGVVGQRIGEMKEAFAKDSDSQQLGHLAADAVIWATKRTKAVCILSKATIRAGLPKGSLARGQLMEALPFNNPLVSIQMPGKQLDQMIRAKNQLLAVSGLRLSNDKVEVRTAAEINQRPFGEQKWEEIQGETMYEVLSSEYLVGGGDNLFPHQEKVGNTQHRVADEVRDLAELYIGHFSPISS